MIQVLSSKKRVKIFNIHGCANNFIIDCSYLYFTSRSFPLEIMNLSVLPASTYEYKVGQTGFFNID